jgi:hypothetical protein
MEKGDLNFFTVGLLTTPTVGLEVQPCASATHGQLDCA